MKMAAMFTRCPACHKLHAHTILTRFTCPCGDRVWDIGSGWLELDSPRIR